jgi:hypothetical protein
MAKGWLRKIVGSEMVRSPGLHQEGDLVAKSYGAYAVAREGLRIRKNA